MIEEPIVCPHTLKSITLNIMFNHRVDSLSVVDKNIPLWNGFMLRRLPMKPIKENVDEVMETDCITVQSDDSIVDVFKYC